MTKILNVECNTNWSVSGAPDWLALDKTSGTGSGTVGVTPSANPDTAQRTANLVFKIPDGSIQQTVTITQAAQPAVDSIVLNPHGYDLLPAGESFVLTITASRPWVLQGNTWLTLSQSSGPAGTTDVTVTATANTTGASRQVTLTATAGTATDTCSITQDAQALTASIYADNIGNRPCQCTIIKPGEPETWNNPTLIDALETGQISKTDSLDFLVAGGSYILLTRSADGSGETSETPIDSLVDGTIYQVAAIPIAITLHNTSLKDKLVDIVPQEFQPDWAQDFIATVSGSADAYLQADGKGNVLVEGFNYTVYVKDVEGATYVSTTDIFGLVLGQTYNIGD